MHITGTHFNYYMICKRKLWLFANSITMEHSSDLVGEGKLIHETTYQQRSDRYKEVEIDGIKIDYYDSKNKVIHEIKKSDKKSDAHTWQLKYYIYVLEKNGIEGVTGILEFPKLRKTEEVLLSDVDRERISEYVKEIYAIMNSDKCPAKLKKSKCRNCSYYEFCWISENDY